jgi:hypothetical protein
MKPLSGTVWGCALLLAAASAAPVQAAWCNVVQVCWHRQKAAYSSYYAPAACCDPCPPPQPVCTTSYVQRCYYQPVTTYETRSYYEPVTTYRTSYYYEPVTSYRYSAYFDPCTCSFQQVACPTTSYQLRSQTCPVQSWVQRCCSVPVTTYRQSLYWEPVTTCCTPTTGTSYYVAPVATPTPGPLPPAVSESPARNGSDALPYNRYYNPPKETPPPPTSGSSYRSVPLGQPAPALPPPKVRLDRIVALPQSMWDQAVGVRNTPTSSPPLLASSR